MVVQEQRQGETEEGYISLNCRGEAWNENQRLFGPSDVFKEYVREHLPDGIDPISPRDLRKSFSTLCETELGVNGTALGFYLGHAGQGVRHQHYTARKVGFLRREVADKVETWVSSSCIDYAS